MPDLTRAQLVALVQAVLGVAIAFGAPITEQQSVAIIALTGVLGSVLIGADAKIRVARNHRARIEALVERSDEQ